ncbi:MerR family transcriptional regulator [Brevibacillus sp. B_LB10_24]|uniref:MerR family transcriptional regulator n=1 Tax=Brevibacillus sp. B_LB10_24 TaxID=3380645 RepID=UPI0038BC6DFC
MLKISAFSKLSGVSVKTLRYYDQIGVLMPDCVDEHSGYRYYSEEQLLTVKRIVSFKEQGFTLEQIKTFLEEQIPFNVVQDRLLDKKRELQDVIQQAQQQFAEVTERLNRLQKLADDDRVETITIRNVRPQLAASIRDVVPRSQLCLLLDEITKYVQANGEEEFGPLTILWHNREDSKEMPDPADIEVAIPLTREIPGSDRVKVGFLPKINQAASLLHHCDPYASSCSAIEELMSWISANSYVPIDSEPFRETYVTSDADIYGRMRLSELLIPVRNK